MVLRDDETLRNWAIFVNQYNEEKIDINNDSITNVTAENYRQQAYFKRQMAIPNVRNWTIELNVSESFVKMLENFGIEVQFNEATKTVNVTKWKPIKMIDWNDMQPADIISVGGTGAASKFIKLATWGHYSHTALYEGGEYVIESLNNGPTRRAKTEFLAPSENVNVMLVKRHYQISPVSARRVVEAAADNVSYGIPPSGKYPMKYNWIGLPSGGMSTTSGQIINAATFPIVPGGIAGGIKAFNDARETARRLANITPESIIFVSPSVYAGKKAFDGQKSRVFCSEAVIMWYDVAGIPITSLPPEHVPPKLIAEDYFKGTLLEVGYLRYKP